MSQGTLGEVHTRDGSTQFGEAVRIKARATWGSVQSISAVYAEKGGGRLFCSSRKEYMGFPLWFPALIEGLIHHSVPEPPGKPGEVFHFLGPWPHQVFGPWSSRGQGLGHDPTDLGRRDPR
jgi:hypothetical protein